MILHFLTSFFLLQFVGFIQIYIIRFYSRSIENSLGEKKTPGFYNLNALWKTMGSFFLF